MVLHHGGDDGRLGAAVEAPTGVAPRSFREVRPAADARKRLLDALELADGEAKLLADERVGSDHPSRRFDTTRGQRRKRNAPPRSEALHQHPPALANALGAADDRIFDLHDHIVSLRRAVPERNAERIVPLAEHHAGCVGRNQGARDAPVFFGTQQVLRVAEFEREAEQRGNGSQRDVALVPVQSDVQLAVLAPKDHAVRRHGAGVGARRGLGESEGWNLLAPCQPRQVVILLRVRAVVHEELGRTERVGHHHRNAQRRR